MSRLGVQKPYKEISIHSIIIEYDELKKREDDNSTIGIVLCEETDEDIARYSILHGNEQLFASKYKLYLPDENELRREISRQKAIFQLQKKEKAALKEVDADE